MTFREELTPEQVADNLRKQIESAQSTIDRYWPTIPQNPLHMRIQCIHEETVLLIEQCVQDMTRDEEERKLDG